MSTVDFLAARALKNLDKASVDETLALISQDIKDGRFGNKKPNKIIAIVIADDTDVDSIRYECYSCGMNWLEELGYLEMIKESRIRNQRDEM